MTEPYERLRQMRLDAGFSSSRAAARALGVPVATYGQHETGKRLPTIPQFQHYEIFFQAAQLIRHFARMDRGIPDAEVLAALTYDSIHKAQVWDDAPERIRRLYLSGLQAAARAAGIHLAEDGPEAAHGAPESP